MDWKRESNQPPPECTRLGWSCDEQDQHDEDNGIENMIIQSDNLDNLKAMLPRYGGKCIYIKIVLSSLIQRTGIIKKQVFAEQILLLGCVDRPGYPGYFTYEEVVIVVYRNDITRKYGA